MQIPNKFDPIALKDLMDFPYKENLFAYYYKGKFYLAPNRSYDEVDTLPRDLTIIVYSINALYTRLAFSDGNHLTIRVFCYYQGVGTVTLQDFTVGGRMYSRYIELPTTKNVIFGGGYGHLYGYYPNNYSIEYTSNGAANDSKEKGTATNVKFGCCFDRKLSKAEFDEVARWILRKQP